MLLANALIKAGYGQGLQDYNPQLRDLERFASSYIAAYTGDFSSNFGFSLNQGWPSDANPGRLGRISFSIVGTSSIIPLDNSNSFIETASLYRSNNVETSYLTPGMYTDASGGNIGVYFLDPVTNNRLVNPLDGAYLSANFGLLDGLGTGAGFTPFIMPQLSVGLGLGTELSMRLLPFTVGIDRGRLQVSAWGAAIRHSLSRWINPSMDAPFHLNMLFSYVQNRLDYNPEGVRFLEFQNAYFNTLGTNVVLQHQTHTMQGMLSGVFKLPKFIDIFFQGGLITQNTNLGSSGRFRLTVNDEYLRDVSEGDEFVADDLFETHYEKSLPIFGAGVIIGRGFLQAELQYNYANSHIGTVAFKINPFTGRKY